MWSEMFSQSQERTQTVHRCRPLMNSFLIINFNTFKERCRERIHYCWDSCLTINSGMNYVLTLRVFWSPGRSRNVPGWSSLCILGCRSQIPLLTQYLRCQQFVEWNEQHGNTLYKQLRAWWLIQPEVWVPEYYRRACVGKCHSKRRLWYICLHLRAALTFQLPREKWDSIF